MKKYIVPTLLCITFIFLFCACELDFEDFSISCDDDSGECTYTEYSSYYDPSNSEIGDDIDLSENTGLGKNIQISEKVKKVCNYIFNDTTTMVRLYRCPCEQVHSDGTSTKYNCMYPSALPGGGINITMPGMGSGDLPYSSQRAANAITFERYVKGAYTSEQPGSIENEATYEFAKAFMILFKGDFVNDYRFRFNSDNEIQFPTGTCTQCYSEANMIQKYDSGIHKEIIDEIYKETKYLILVNDDGKLTSTEYAGTRKNNGPTFIMGDWSKDGMKFLDILRNMRTSTESPSFQKYYKTSNIYDCRNLLEN